MTLGFFQLSLERFFRNMHTLTNKFPLSRKMKWC
jgi:hypothetical protein